MFDPKQLDNFIGSTQFYWHWTRSLIYTDGIHYLVENGAAWLVDAIASYQFEIRLHHRELRDFQLWTLKVADNVGVLECRADSDRKPVIEQRIEFTDFPMPEITLYVERGEYLTLLLPSEH